WRQDTMLLTRPSINNPPGIVIKEYDFPDIDLLRGEPLSARFMVWIPAFLCSVLGQSNFVEFSLHMENILEDNIPIYKRPSGGEAVVLSPRMVVVSILKRGDTFRAPRLYFKTYNEMIINVLHGLGVKELRAEGISDVCIRDRKILGSSIYRNKDLVFYHAVLNVSEDIELMERYLKHPRLEPDYREGRSHREFVSSVSREGYALAPEEIRQAISKSLIAL
ncbi:MAG: lipoate---protein ligase, partial [Acidobacteriota bacterium]|nr:lipoate---protein ligase [Acidobacteriota bacterium]